MDIHRLLILSVMLYLEQSYHYPTIPFEERPWTLFFDVHLKTHTFR